MSGKIFVSYRRDDDPSAAARIRDGLAARFGKNSVFMDVDNLLAGQRFDEELAKALAACDVLIAVLGTRWMGLLEARAQSGERDYVREEIAGALKRRIVVVPIRVGRDGQLAPLPRAMELPEDVRDLVQYQKHDVTHENFGRDVAELGNAIAIVRRSRSAPRPWGGIAACVIAALFLGGGAWLAPKFMSDSPRVRATAVEATSSLTSALATKPVAKSSTPEHAETKLAFAARPASEASATCDGKLVKVSSEEQCLKPGDSFRDCDNCPEMIVLPSGSFTMGSRKEEEDRSEVKDTDEDPLHNVTIAWPFAVGKFEVTRGQFRAFVEATGHKTGDSCWVYDGKDWEDTPGKFWRNLGFVQADNHPVACVSWDDTKAYVIWLAKVTGKAYRLVSEAEWEYAARGETNPGSYTRFHFGNAEIELCDYANGADSSTSYDWQNKACSDNVGNSTAPVDGYKPNAFGLHNMHGNVWEWTEDCYHENYLGAPTDGSTWDTACTEADRHVVRGGSWNSNPRNLRAADRNTNPSNHRNIYMGFRVARTLSP